MQAVPRNEASTVAVKTAPLSIPDALNTFGFTARIYAMVINVVIPARISVFTVVWFSRSLNSFSNIMLNPSCKILFRRKTGRDESSLPV